MGMPRMTPPVEGSYDAPKRKVNWFLMLIIGVIGFCLVMMILGTVIVLPAIARAQEVGQNRSCVTRLRAVSRALEMYMVNNNDHYPLSIVPREFAPKMRANRYFCPRTRTEFRLNDALAGKTTSSVVDKKNTLVIFEASLDGKMHFEHQGKANGAFADGAVRPFGPEEKLASPSPDRETG